MAAVRMSLPASEEHKTRDTIATFIAKVWKIVEKPDYSKYIHWSDSGKTFVVCDYSNFSHDILPQYFKHSNFSSFVRQLNLYGFRKVNHPEQGTLAKTHSDEPLEFWHTNFRRGHPELLHLVQRKVASQVPRIKSEIKQTQKPLEGHDDLRPVITRVLGDIHQMQGRQENIVLVLDALKQDNSHLRHELGMLKEKSVRQQKVLNKIVQFLVHMVYQGKLPTRRPTNNQLMLMDAASVDGPPSPKRMRPMNAAELDSIVDFNNLPSPVGEPLAVVPPLVSLDTPTSGLSPESNPSVQSQAFQFDQLASTTPISPGTGYTTPLQSPAKSVIPDVSSPTSLPPSTTFTSLPSTTNASNMTFPMTSPFMNDFTNLPTASENVSSTDTSDFTAQPSMSYANALSGLEVVPVQSTSGDSTILPVDSGVGLEETADLSEMLQLPFISADLLNEYPIHPAPSSLVPNPHPENRLCINGQVNHQQNGIDAIPNMVSGHLSLDPGLISEFISYEGHPVPNYDFVDTARLLECLTNFNQETITDENTLHQQLQRGSRSLLPPTDVSTSSTTTQPTTSVPDTTSQLHKLLEEGVK